VPATVVLLSALAVACVPAAQLLAGAAWPRRCPVAGIALWQALGLGWGLAAVGALAGLGLSGPIADIATERWGMLGVLRLLSLAASVGLLTLLCGILVAAIAAVLKARHRQRALLDLLAR